MLCFRHRARQLKALLEFSAGQPFSLEQGTFPGMQCFGLGLVRLLGGGRPGPTGADAGVRAEGVVVVHLVVVHAVPMQVALLLVLRTGCTRFELIFQVIQQKERSASLIAPPIVCIALAFFSQWKNATFLRL